MKEEMNDQVQIAQKSPKVEDHMYMKVVEFDSVSIYLLTLQQ